MRNKRMFTFSFYSIRTKDEKIQVIIQSLLLNYDKFSRRKPSKTETITKFSRCNSFWPPDTIKNEVEFGKESYLNT